MTTGRPGHAVLIIWALKGGSGTTESAQLDTIARTRDRPLAAIIRRMLSVAVRAKLAAYAHTKDIPVIVITGTVLVVPHPIPRCRALRWRI
jgi:hypothetical protein